MITLIRSLFKQSSPAVWLVLCLVAAVALAYLPQVERLQQSRAAYQISVQELAWLKVQAATKKPRRAQEPAGANPSASSLETLVEAANLRDALTELRAISEGKLALSFAAADFGRISDLLGQLNAVHGPVIQELSVTARSPGVVDALIIVAGSTL